MANDSGFGKMILICASGLIAGIVVIFLLRALFPGAGLVPQTVGIVVAVAIAVPPLAAYFKKRM